MADMDKVTEYVDEARRMGLAVLPPDVNRSEVEFAVEGETIRYGLSAVKGVGDAAAAAVVEGRRSGPYRSLFDLCERVCLKAVNKPALEALVKAGAGDAIGPGRASLHAAIDRAMRLGASASADRTTGQMGLFGAGGRTDAERMGFERELIGFYATDHPLARHERLLRRLSSAPVPALADLEDRTEVRLGGMIRSPRVSLVKSGPNEGRRMAFFTLEDFAGSVECVVFSRAYGELHDRIASDRVVVVEGRLDRSRETPSVQVDRIVPVEEAAPSFARGLLVRLETADDRVLEALEAEARTAPGPLPVVLEFRPEPDVVARVRAGPSWNVTASDDLVRRLGLLPSVAAVEYLAAEP
jgi:DNA polymerase-3 subunit alpha